MRIIHLTIQGEQLTADSRVAGQSGEHLATALSLAIPEDWQDCSCTLRFSLPSAGLYYRSGPLKSPILFPLPQALMVPGELKVFLDARKDFEVHRTSVRTLVVEESLDWCGGPLAADRYEGLLDMTLQEIGDALGKLEDLTDRLNEADALAASTQQAAEWAEDVYKRQHSNMSKAVRRWPRRMKSCEQEFPTISTLSNPFRAHTRLCSRTGICPRKPFTPLARLFLKSTPISRKAETFLCKTASCWLICSMQR